MNQIRVKTDSLARRIFLIATLFVVAGLHWYIGSAAFANMIATHADQTDITDLAISLAPADPQTHFAAAVLYDKTFLTADQQRSLDEYRRAAELSPNNYIVWMEYGQALGRSGDRERAELALRRAARLAPNYASVQWALGNLLIRKGNETEGFDRMKRAVEGNPTYSAPATAFAFQYFDGDVTSVRKAIGDLPRANAALALLLARDKRYDEAVEVWSAISGPSDATMTEQGRALANELITAKRFANSLTVYRSLGRSSASPETIGNGGFEEAIKLDNPGPFEWSFTAGQQPQALQSTAQPHGGARCLVLRFGSNDGSGLSQTVQTVVVRPIAKYVFSGFYRADLKTSSKIAWRVLNSSTGAVVAEVFLDPSRPEWTEFSVGLTVPADTDGVTLQLLVMGCGSTICPISGTLWLDDIDLRGQHGG